jgi:hypothetical protein
MRIVCPQEGGAERLHLELLRAVHDGVSNKERRLSAVSSRGISLVVQGDGSTFNRIPLPEIISLCPTSVRGGPQQHCFMSHDSCPLAVAKSSADEEVLLPFITQKFPARSTIGF